MLKKIKFLFLLLFLLIGFLFIFNSNSFAFTIEKRDGTEVDLPDLPNDYNPSLCLYAYDNNWHSIFIPAESDSNGAYFKLINNNSVACYNSNDEQINFLYYGTRGDWDSWADRGISMSNISFVVGNYSRWGLKGTIYNTDGTIFFQVTPPVEIVETEKTLAEVVAESQPEMVLMEILNLLPLIIAVVASLVGLRKGLTLLSQILHKA